MLRFLLRFFYLFVLVLGSFSVAEAGVVVSPIQLKVDAKDPIALLTLTNNDPSPITFQIQPFHWTQKNGMNTLTPVTNLIISPPIFTLPGKGSQLIRLGFFNLAFHEKPP